MCAKSLQSCPTLCDPIDHSPPDSSVHGILQARTLDELPRPPPGDLPDPGTEPRSLASPALAGGFFTSSATWDAQSGGQKYYKVNLNNNALGSCLTSPNLKYFTIPLCIFLSDPGLGFELQHFFKRYLQ